MTEHCLGLIEATEVSKIDGCLEAHPGVVRVFGHCGLEHGECTGAVTPVPDQVAERNRRLNIMWVCLAHLAHHGLGLLGPADLAQLGRQTKPEVVGVFGHRTHLI
jgi:hypothetical protein